MIDKGMIESLASDALHEVRCAVMETVDTGILSRLDDLAAYISLLASCVRRELGAADVVAASDLVLAGARALATVVGVPYGATIAAPGAEIAATAELAGGVKEYSVAAIRKSVTLVRACCALNWVNAPTDAAQREREAPDMVLRLTDDGERPFMAVYFDDLLPSGLADSERVRLAGGDLANAIVVGRAFLQIFGVEAGDDGVVSVEHDTYNIIGVGASLFSATSALLHDICQSVGDVGMVSRANDLPVNPVVVIRVPEN